MSKGDAQLLNSQILPKVAQIHQMIRGFHGKEIQDFQQIIKNVQVVEDELRDKQEECENYINQIKNKRKDQDKLGQLSKGVLEAKSEQMKSKTKNIDAVSTGIKETVAKIKPKNLIKLPVKEDRNLNKVFQVLYKTVYADQKAEFDWKVFKEQALEHEDGQDFISRLVNLNFKEMSADKYDRLMELKNDPQFQVLSVKSKHSEHIIDIADWVEYVCLGYQFSNQKKRAEKDYDKIRKDMDKKAKGSLQMSENFWKEASTQIQTYQSQIQNISSELKSILFGLKKSVEDSNELGAKTREKIQQIERAH